VSKDGQLMPGIGVVPRSGAAETCVDINDVVLDALGRLIGDLRSHRVVVTTSLESGLPPVKGNEAQLQQAFVYLIENAIEAMADTAWRTRLLRICTARRGGGILITVEDRGRGIALLECEHLFDPLYTTKPKRVGLGLPTCRFIVAAHGGQVWAMPGETRGAVLQVALPGMRPT
jgi:C4-dicarboxylate-specific signal transduction histidine kinase